MGKLWGPNPSTVRWLFEGIVKPSLTYGCLVWGHALKTKSTLMKLHRLQRLALLPMSPARSQTPTAGMEILANVTPLTIHIQEMALRTYIRIKSYLPAWDNLGKLNLRGHLFKIMKQANNLNIPLDNLDKIPLTFHPKNSLKLELTDFGTIPPPHQKTHS